MVLQFHIILSIKIIFLHDNSQLSNNLLYQATHYPNCESSPYNHHHYTYPIHDSNTMIAVEKEVVRKKFTWWIHAHNQIELA